jgi:hypothetical protein
MFMKPKISTSKGEQVMKKYLLILLTVLQVTALLALTAAPALGAGLTLVHVASRPSRGLTLTFDISEGYANETSGTASVGWRTYPMYCGANSSGKLLCFIGSGIYRHAGKTALVTIGGQTFSVVIPSKVGDGKSLPAWWCDAYPQDHRCNKDH